MRGINLTGANLSGINLTDAILRAANLTNATLDDAKLLRADLRDAQLTSASLQRTNLSGALLSRAYLENADLRGAHLGYSSLIGAHFAQAQLDSSSFHKAKLRNTVFTDVDLSECRSLGSCVHRGPSTLDYRTIVRSANLPLRFLRGCGVPERLIEYLPSLLKKPIQFYSCFISYSSQDQVFAERLHADLQDAGVRCWFAPHDISGGRKIHEQIDEAIRVYDRLLLLLSEASMASGWIKLEVAHARRREIAEGRQVLFPIAIAPFETIRKWQEINADIGEDTAREIREYFIPDFSGWDKVDLYRSALRKLIKDLASNRHSLPGNR